MSLRAVPPPQPCECEARHCDMLFFCLCSCHHAGPLTRASFAAAIRHMSEGGDGPSATTPDWAKIRAVPDDD